MMANPEYLFYVLMFGVAAPAGWRGNHVAAAVFLRWALAMLAQWAGLPEPATLVILFSAAFSLLAVDVFVNIARYQRRRDVTAWLAFIPLQIIANLQMGRTLDPWLAWWLIYWIGIGQVALIVDRRTLDPVRWLWRLLRRVSAPFGRLPRVLA